MFPFSKELLNFTNFIGQNVFLFTISFSCAILNKIERGIFMAKITIRRIAELAGVSTTTVSYVLNNRPGISEETRMKVQAIMDQEHYAPGPNTLRTGTKRSHTIYMMIDEFTSFGNLFYSTILDSMSVAAEKYGYNIVLSNKFESFQACSAAKAIKQGTTDGVIFLHDVDSETLLFLQQHQTPFVVIDSHKKDASYMRVCADYDGAAHTVTNYLISLGHRKLAFIGQASFPDFYVTTFRGFCRALTENKLAIHPQWLQSDAYDFDSASQCMQNILQCEELPTGIVCATDLFALAAMQSAQIHGYRIPDDFSFVGIDDLNSSSAVYPTLTTIHLDHYEFAERAVKLLHKQITASDPHIYETSVLRSDQLIVRNSTGPVSVKE